MLDQVRSTNLVPKGSPCPGGTLNLNANKDSLSATFVKILTAVSESHVVIDKREKMQQAKRVRVFLDELMMQKKNCTK
jgi:hypothetical protein